MFKRIKGFIRMKREQRELRSRMSEKTYRQLMLIQDDLMKLRDRLSEESMKELEKMEPFTPHSNVTAGMYTTYGRILMILCMLRSVLNKALHFFCRENYNFYNRRDL